MKKRRKPRYAYYAEPKVRRPYCVLDPMFKSGPLAAGRLSWPADCRWWNYSDRPAPYKPGTPR